jgi:hypothetical protein
MPPPGLSAEQDSLSRDLFQYELNQLLELFVCTDANTKFMPKYGAKSRLHWDYIEPVIKGLGVDHGN